MQVSEILRKIADVIDRAEADEPVQPIESEPETHVTVSHARLSPVDAAVDVDNDPLTMVSPLQQEHELLKKSQGVDNNVSEFAGDEDEEYNDELESMKQMAGIGEETACAKAQEEDRRLAGQLNPRKNAALAFHKARSDRS